MGPLAKVFAHPRYQPDRPVPFNWFFFGKRLFDPSVGQSFLKIARGGQFYAPESGNAYTHTAPSSRFFIALPGQTDAELEQLCREHRFQGFVRRRVPGSSLDAQIPPVPLEVDFFFVDPDVLRDVSDWHRSKLLQYAMQHCRGHSADSLCALVVRFGLPEASQIVYQSVS